MEISPALTDEIGLRRVAWQKTFSTPTGLHHGAKGFNPFRVDDFWRTITQRSPESVRGNAGLKDLNPVEIQALPTALVWRAHGRRSFPATRRWVWPGRNPCGGGGICDD
jgi:hypothetical protein